MACGAPITPLLQDWKKRMIVFRIGRAARAPGGALRHDMLETGKHMALDAPEIRAELTKAQPHVRPLSWVGLK